MLFINSCKSADKLRLYLCSNNTIALGMITKFILMKMLIVINVCIKGVYNLPIFTHSMW